MDILIPDSWLRDYLDTKATPEKLAECLSLCGPSVERLQKVGKDVVYEIEVTTNRVDMASVVGIAREANAILLQFGLSAKMLPLNVKVKYGSKKLPLKVSSDKTLVKRITAVLLTNISVKDSPEFIQDRLKKVGQRPLNNAIDITNYVMFALGTPLHAFDWDKLTDKTLIVKEAQRGETFTTLDGVSRKTKGGEVVFKNSSDTIIDLPGIMGTENTKVDKNTKNILLLSESVDPLKIRKASLAHELRTHAAALNEKNVDPESLPSAIEFATLLFQKHAGAVVGSDLFDWYPQKGKVTPVATTLADIEKALGVKLSTKEVDQILTSLEFETKWQGDKLTVTPPTFRSHEFSIPEDIVEEVARIYGYFKLPSNLPEGQLPTGSKDTHFAFEMKIKNLLRGWGGVEVYTLSMVSKEMVVENAVRIKNPLGNEGEYMRTTITPSLLNAVKDNVQEKSSFYLFEIANVYIPQKNDLPTEEQRLCVVFANTEYRVAKGTLEALFLELNIPSIPVLTKQDGVFVYEVSIAELMKNSTPFRKFTPIPKFPAHIEDITVVLGKDSKVGTVMDSIKKESKLISKVELKDIYEDSYTFRLYYQDKTKTITDAEATEIRTHLTHFIKKNLNLSVKE